MKKTTKAIGYVLCGAIVACIASSAYARSVTIQLWFDKQCGAFYAPGEKVFVSFRTNVDGYVTVYNTDTTGRVSVLFPNRHHPDNFVKGNQMYTVPDRSYSYDLIAEGPEGIEYVDAVASTDPRYYWDYNRSKPHWVNNWSPKASIWSSEKYGTASCYFYIGLPQPPTLVPPARTSTLTSSMVTATCNLTVSQTQKILKELGYNPGPLDGIRGKKTRAAVEQFQRDRGLMITGTLDTKTAGDLCRVSERSCTLVNKYNEEIVTLTEEIAKHFSELGSAIYPYFDESKINYELIEKTYHSTINKLYDAEKLLMEMNVPPYESCREFHNAIIEFVQDNITFARALGEDVALYMREHNPGTPQDIELVGTTFYEMFQRNKKLSEKVNMKQKTMADAFSIALQNRI